MSGRGFRNTFGYRLFWYFASMILVAAPLFTIAAVSYQKKVMTDDLVKEGRIITSLLVSSLRTWIFAENAENIRDSLTGIMDHGNIASVVIYNDKGGIIYTGRRNKSTPATGVTPAPDFASMKFTGDEGAPLNIQDLKDSIEIICPVKMELAGTSDMALYFDDPSGQKKNINIGYIRVGLSKEGLRAEMFRIAVRVAIGAIIGILAGLAVLYIAVIGVTRPLRELTANLRRFGAGDSIRALPVSGSDEIGELSEAFNSMAEDLRRREQETIALQERLKESEKLEAVGRLSRGIAHDFNNILSTVQGSVYMLEKKFGDSESIMYYVEKIRNSLSRSGRLLQSIVSYSRARAAELRPIELNSIIKRMTTLLESISGEAISLNISLSDEELVVMGDTLQIEQVIMNLAANAKDAMPDGGALTIRTSPVTLDGGGAEKVEGAGGKRYAAIEVIDTGTGIDEEARERIFDPFFTTKDPGGGTGLGLAIVTGIVERHGGHVGVRSQPDHGTAFTVQLPLFENKGKTYDNIH
ncbi:MAG: HAMP domain-containing protein [Nitrospirae bacterium]|nr:HAMP domain-containing protein [Nitrospirota bacterium]